MSLEEWELNVQVENPVDLLSLAPHGCDLRSIFQAQDLMEYFNMLNGPTYVELVKDFWVRAEVYDEEAANNEELKAVTQDPSFRRKEPRSPRFEMLLGKLLFVKTRRG